MTTLTVSCKPPAGSHLSRRISGAAPIGDSRSHINRRDSPGALPLLSFSANFVVASELKSRFCKAWKSSETPLSATRWPARTARRVRRLICFCCHEWGRAGYAPGKMEPLAVARYVQVVSVRVPGFYRLLSGIVRDQINFICVLRPALSRKQTVVVISSDLLDAVFWKNRERSRRSRFTLRPG